MLWHTAMEVDGDEDRGICGVFSIVVCCGLFGVVKVEESCKVYFMYSTGTVASIPMVSMIREQHIASSSGVLLMSTSQQHLVHRTRHLTTIMYIDFLFQSGLSTRARMSSINNVVRQ